MRKSYIFLSVVMLISRTPAWADSNLGSDYLKEASRFYQSGKYFKAARYAYAAMEEDARLKPNAYAWVTLSLLRAKMPNAAAYFFIRTLQTGNKAAIRTVLTQTQELLVTVGADILRKYLIRHTAYEDYDAGNLSAYLYAIGKDVLVSGDSAKAISYLNGIGEDSPLLPYMLQLRGAARAILGKNEEALADFRACASQTRKISQYDGNDPLWRKQREREADDLKSRCVAGEARTLYQMERFDDADRVYDDISKHSFVWPDILFEQAWNSFGRKEYNRTLGKLVSYKSPALSFVFNPEVDVLRAQAYLALCLYSDANDVINDFNSKYSPVGIEVKHFVENNAKNLPVFYDLGKKALHTSLYSKSGFYQLANRFVRGPSFQALVANERQVAKEVAAIRQFDSTQLGVPHNLGQGFPGFLNQVLQWRLNTIRLLGGAFVKNSLLDYHASLIEDFEKIAFIKLEMLKYSKEKLIYKQSTHGSRDWGNVQPSRRWDQLEWSFNGEFWTDELGDYVFGLESECKS